VIFLVLFVLRSLQGVSFFSNTSCKNSSTLDNYVKYLDIACELGKIDKVQVIEMVKNKNNKKQESIQNLLD
jgi:hypothetical protein